MDNIIQTIPIGEIIKIPHHICGESFLEWRQYEIEMRWKPIHDEDEAFECFKQMVPAFLDKCDRLYALKQRQIIVCPFVKWFNYHSEVAGKAFDSCMMIWYMEKDDYIAPENFFN